MTYPINGHQVNGSGIKLRFLKCYLVLVWRDESNQICFSVNNIWRKIPYKNFCMFAIALLSYDWIFRKWRLLDTDAGLRSDSCSARWNTMDSEELGDSRTLSARFWVCGGGPTDDPAARRSGGRQWMGDFWGFLDGFTSGFRGTIFRWPFQDPIYWRRLPHIRPM